MVILANLRIGQMDTFLIILIIKHICISINIRTLLFGELTNIELNRIARKLLNIPNRVIPKLIRIINKIRKVIKM